MNIKLEQLKIFDAVITHSGVNNAAKALHKSPSAVSHSLTMLQEQLQVALFETQGRKLALTSKGNTLLKYARQILEDKQALIDAANRLHSDQKQSINIAVDSIYPQARLFQALESVTIDQPWCKIRVDEHILSGVEDAVISGNADLGIGYRIPEGYVGTKLLEIPFYSVAAPSHPLAKMKDIDLRTLKKHRQIVIADSGTSRVDSGWLKAEQRWTMSSLYSALNVAVSGFAYARLPLHLVEQHLNDNKLVKLDLNFHFEKIESLFGFAADPECSLSKTIMELLKQNND